MKSDDLLNRATTEYTYGQFSPSEFSKNGEIVLIPWNSSDGWKRLVRANVKEGFLQLADCYQPQINPLYCGVASCVIVLNALRHAGGKIPAQENLSVTLPNSDQKIPFKTYSQITFLRKVTESVKPKAVVEYQSPDEKGQYRPGLSLLEMKGLLEVYETKVIHSFAAETKEESFRKEVQKNLATKTHFMLIHFRADKMGGVQRGHISPLAAYDKDSDSVLVLDVGSHKSPWYWAPVSHLFQAMAVTYDTQPKGGGYLIVSEK